MTRTTVARRVATTMPRSEVASPAPMPRRRAIQATTSIIAAPMITPAMPAMNSRATDCPAIEP